MGVLAVLAVLAQAVRVAEFLHLPLRGRLHLFQEQMVQPERGGLLDRLETQVTQGHLLLRWVRHFVGEPGAMEELPVTQAMLGPEGPEGLGEEIYLNYADHLLVMEGLELVVMVVHRVRLLPVISQTSYQQFKKVHSFVLVAY
jgi:hypothetical protein